ncbi:hypothetical protein E3E12_07815 [Formicincola oecophyllae]|uniref:Uncharacterized protein n=1 Tax=Formicincola oecophyllae TaxID=2558361 RepID=A0A4Y6U9P3_9PROT|nr:hypothetical protein [Formicincola oecophyllae]QDH14102.1 hypothetical protein E3E12_07815 [Formicincola oecophyllae]
MIPEDTYLDYDEWRFLSEFFYTSVHGELRYTAKILFHDVCIIEMTHEDAIDLIDVNFLSWSNKNGRIPLNYFMDVLEYSEEGLLEDDADVYAPDEYDEEEVEDENPSSESHSEAPSSEASSKD